MRVDRDAPVHFLPESRARRSFASCPASTSLLQPFVRPSIRQSAHRATSVVGPGRATSVVKPTPAHRYAYAFLPVTALSDLEFGYVRRGCRGVEAENDFNAEILVFRSHAAGGDENAVAAVHRPAQLPGKEIEVVLEHRGPPPP